MPISTGIDIVNVARMQKVIADKGEAFLRRVFSDTEIAYCEKKVNRYQHYAARFAAKEAFLKALSVTDHPIALRDIEVRKNGAVPSIYIAPASMGTMPESISLSIAHEKEFAVAVVVVEYASSGSKAPCAHA